MRLRVLNNRCQEPPFHPVGSCVPSCSPLSIASVVRPKSKNLTTLTAATDVLSSLACSSSMSPAATLDASPGGARLLLVSNRLPITIRRSEAGKYEFSMSSGGLVTGLSGLSKTTTFQWYGWPGLEVPEDEVATVKQRLKEDYNATPVFIDDKLADKHYNGFSSKQSQYPLIAATRQATGDGRLTMVASRLDPMAPPALPSR